MKLLSPVDSKFMKVFPITTAYAVSLFKGDLVGEGSPTGLVCGALGGGVRPNVERAVTGTACVYGVVMATFDSDMLPTTYYPASAAGDGVVGGYLLVYTDPNAEYLCQEDGDSAATSAANILYNADMIWTHTGSSISGVSAMEIDSNTAATTSTLALKLLRYMEGDTVATAGCRWICKINASAFNLNITAV
jgi:hypothetical protein